MKTKTGSKVAKIILAITAVLAFTACTPEQEALAVGTVAGGVIGYEAGKAQNDRYDYGYGHHGYHNGGYHNSGYYNRGYYNRHGHYSRYPRDGYTYRDGYYR
jgi:uncharacterized membrane protein